MNPGLLADAGPPPGRTNRHENIISKFHPVRIGSMDAASEQQLVELMERVAILEAREAERQRAEEQFNEGIRDLSNKMITLFGEP